MGTISVSLPSDGTIADVADVNTPITTIVDEFNGNIDNDNIKTAAAIAGSKLASASVTSTQIDFGGSGAGVWWQEIGRTTLGVAGDTISIATIVAKRYLQIHCVLINTGSIQPLLRFNNDSGNNYALRTSDDGAAQATATSQSSIVSFSSSQPFPFFINFDVLNLTATEKMVTGTIQIQNTAGAANIPGVREHFSKWANTADQITRVDIVNGGAGDFAIGSEIVVLGHD